MKKPLIVVITVLSKIAICRNQYLFSNPRKSTKPVVFESGHVQSFRPAGRRTEQAGGLFYPNKKPAG